MIGATCGAEAAPHVAEARAALLNLLAELWGGPVRAEHVGGLRALARLFPQHAAVAVGTGDLPALGAAFDIHLRIPGDRALRANETSHLSPGERVTGPARIAQVAGIYAAAEYELEPFTQLAPDHIVHELRFLAALATSEARAQSVGNPAVVVRLQGWREGFVADHAGRWLGALADHADRVGAHPFYCALSRATLAAVVEAGGSAG